jgi:hypothetical protein
VRGHGFHTLCTHCFRNRVDDISDRGFIARFSASRSQIWPEVNLHCLGWLLGGGVEFLLNVRVENPDCGIATSPRIEYD